MKSNRQSTMEKSTNIKKLSSLSRFFLYGLFGITIDVFYFALLDTVVEGELHLTGRTNVLILPIYGLAFLLMEQISSYLKHINLPMYARGVIYVLMGYTFEFATGLFLRQIGHDLWDYSDFSYNFKGIIIPHTALGWFLLGLAAEAIVIDGVKRLYLTSR